MGWPRRRFARGVSAGRLCVQRIQRELAKTATCWPPFLAVRCLREVTPPGSSPGSSAPQAEGGCSPSRAIGQRSGPGTEAAPVSLLPRSTSAIFAATRALSSAACWTLRAISWVAAPCSSTAAAMVEEISDIRSMVELISLMVDTESVVAACSAGDLGADARQSLIAVWEASALTSEATTANPPAGFPRTGGLDGRVEREQVGLFSNGRDQLDDIADAGGGFGTARRCWRRSSEPVELPICLHGLDSSTCRLISLTDEVSSSLAVAVDWMLSETFCDALAAELESCRVRSAALVSVPAVASISVEADEQGSDHFSNHGSEFAGGAIHGLGPAHFGTGLSARRPRRLRTLRSWHL